MPFNLLKLPLLDEGYSSLARNNSFLVFQTGLDLNSKLSSFSNRVSEFLSGLFGGELTSGLIPTRSGSSEKLYGNFRSSIFLKVIEILQQKTNIK
jgi:hypothetical protein